MIELTVKTLDSQNHQFTVEDDITVEQFKAHIADTVNIPAETQRIIYCGRVLQDNLKLSEYDVNGKVVHLVQRAPPGATPRSNSRSSSPQPQRRYYRPYRGLEQGNAAMYLGSMAFPGNLMESQGIVPPPPTHSLSGSRLNVARRMLRRAEAVIQQLENPSARPQEQNQTDENQEEEEVTPVIEARVIVPNNNEAIDEVLNAVQNSLINATAGALSVDAANRNAGGSGAHSNTESAQRSPNQSETSTPGGPTPRSSSTENLVGEQRAENSTGLPENASRTTEMADLLTMLGQLQARFAPFLERYQNFMQDDPEIPAEHQRQTQLMLNRVSEVLHFLGHAYHSLSDILIRVRTPPPRPLLCRPILIQHSAVVQTGIPIQVEAQINLSADRPPPSTSTTQTQNTTTATTETTSAPTTNTNTNSTTTSGSGGPTISVQSGFVGLPFLPGTAMRVQSFPVEIRTVRSAMGTPRPQNNNNVPSATATTTTASSTPAPPPPPPPPVNAVPPQPQQPTNAQEQGQGGAFNFNNPNVEFFMEVTPEGITIDSLETTLVGSNEANDLLRGALNRPPPEFLQSLMQMAGQIINRNIPATTVSATSTTTETTQAQATTQPSGQNSQARGNTQTNPTTATSTRSTPRPHVHLAQQAMQGGFDPFLPCNSHHISRRRVPVAQASGSNSAPSTQQAASSQPTAPRPEPPQAPRATPQQQNFGNILVALLDSISPQRRPTEQRQGSSNGTTSTSASGDSSRIGQNPQNPFSPLAALFSNIQGGGNLPDLLRVPTLEQVLHQIQQDDQYVPGESIVTDLIMLLVRNLTLLDLFTLNSGNTEPINRNIHQIQNFFRVRICDGDTSPEGVNRGVDRLITEMQPFLENFSSLSVRDNIDMVRTAQQLFRQRLPDIINTTINLNHDNVRNLLNSCIDTAKQLLALTLNASRNGQQGVEQIFEQVMNRFMQDVPAEIQNWTVMTSRIRLRQVLSNLNIPDSAIQPYIVHQQESVPVPRTNSFAQPEVEAMELDEPEATSSDLGSPTIMLDDTEPLPHVVLGSEPWHSQVPEDWVPIITRDAQKQRRQNSQGPFSDAYLSGMPSKRRKIVNNSKPQGSLPQVITDSVRQAVSATGLTSAAPLDNVSQLAGASPEIQNAYRNLLRTTVQANLRDNEDFLPERFPNISNYFNNEH